MLRETTFWVGGILTIGLGVALVAGLAWAGAGWDYLDAWLASGMAVGFGAFFLSVGRGEHLERLRFLAETEKTPPTPPGPGSR